MHMTPRITFGKCSSPLRVSTGLESYKGTECKITRIPGKLGPYFKEICVTGAEYLKRFCSSKGNTNLKRHCDLAAPNVQLSSSSEDKDSEFGYEFIKLYPPQ